MAFGDRWKVTATSGLNIRSGPSTNTAIKGALKNGQTVTELESSGSWIKHAAGWSSSNYMTKINTSASVNTTTTNPSNSGVSGSQQQQINEESGKNSDGSTSGAYVNTDTIVDMDASDQYQDNLSSNLMAMDSVIGCFGLPYQFLPSTDPRTDATAPVSGSDREGVGFEYGDRIVAKMPILFIAPGRPNFMTKFSETEKESVIQKAIENATGAVSNAVGLEDLLENEGRYYTFDYATDYYQYVNPMCRIAARYLEIQDFSLSGDGGGRLDTMDWREYTMGHIKGLFSSAEYSHIPFYLDSDTNISEDFGNSLGESSLASTVNGVSDLGRELNFLTGYTSRALDTDFLSEGTVTYIENIQQEIEQILGKGNFLTNLTKHLSTVASGGRLTFPKIWTDSDIGRSYNVKIKLVSPDANKLSIFLNILVHLFHLIGLVAPQSIATNPNGYTSPFIVRALYKSFFNVDMGIITSMSVDRGGNCMWTVDGLPTSIEVSMTIKDLYEVMSISKTTLTSNWKYDTMSNTAQMDYIANLCGINMYKPEVARQISMWLVNEVGAAALDVPRNIWYNIQQKIGSTVMNIFRN